MKSVRDQVWTQISVLYSRLNPEFDFGLELYPVWDQVWDQVGYQVWNQS